MFILQFLLFVKEYHSNRYVVVYRLILLLEAFLVSNKGNLIRPVVGFLRLDILPTKNRMETFHCIKPLQLCELGSVLECNLDMTDSFQSLLKIQCSWKIIINKICMGCELISIIGLKS